MPLLKLTLDSPCLTFFLESFCDRDMLVRYLGMGPGHRALLELTQNKFDDVWEAFFPDGGRCNDLAEESDTDDEDSSVRELLQKLDNVPLAVTLMANLAQVQRCEVLLEQWADVRTAMLTRNDHRLSSLDVSVELSLKSARLGAATGSVLEQPVANERLKTTRDIHCFQKRYSLSSRKVESLGRRRKPS